MAFSLDFNVLVQGGVLALLLYIARLLAGMAKWQAQTSVVLTGINGDNGIVGDVKALRAKMHEHGQAIHVVDGKTTVLTIRVEKLEEERRDGIERREHDRGDERRRA